MARRLELLTSFLFLPMVYAPEKGIKDSQASCCHYLLLATEKSCDFGKDRVSLDLGLFINTVLFFVEHSTIDKAFAYL